MDNLEFRKFLTEYGISNEEYENMTDEEKQKLTDKFKQKEKANNLNKIGNGFKGCGCLIMMIPLLILLLYVLFSFIKGLF